MSSDEKAPGGGVPELSEMYVGNCAMCSRPVYAPPVYPGGFPVLLCSTHDAGMKAHAAAGGTLIYCLHCQKITFTLRLDKAVYGDPVMFNEECPVCQKDFQSFNLRRWTDYPPTPRDEATTN